MMWHTGRFLSAAALAIGVACAGCGGGGPGPRATPAPTLASPRGGGGGNAPGLATPAELAHRYHTSVFVPLGIVLYGGVTVQVDAAGQLAHYGIGLFNGFGDLYVDGAAPASTAQYRTAADDDPQRTIMTRAIVTVHGRDAVLFQETYGGPSLQDFRLLWTQDGRLLQLAAPAQVGRDAVLAAAEATKLVSEASVDTANIIVDTRPDPTGGPQLSTPADAARLLGVPVFAPPSYVRVLVWPDRVTGKPTHWTIDVTETLTIEQWTGGVPSDADVQRTRRGATSQQVRARGNAATFVRTGGSAELYLAVDGQALLIHDLTGQDSAAQLADVAAGLRRVDGGGATPGASATATPPAATPAASATAAAAPSRTPPAQTATATP